MSKNTVRRQMWWARSVVAAAIGLSALTQSSASAAQDEGSTGGQAAAPAAATPGGSPAASDPMAEARKHFSAGVSLLDDPDGARYEDAYHAFKKAYELSRSPKVLGNIGFCAFKLERDGEAIDAYSAYLREARDIEPREKAQIERDLATLNASVARVKVTTRRAGTFVVIDTRMQTRGTPVVNTYAFDGGEATLRLRPGRHSIKLKGEELESIAYEATIEPASQSSHELTFAPPMSVAVAREGGRSSPSYAGPVVLGLVGLAAVGAGVTTGLMARGKTDDIEARCPGDVCPADYDLRSDRSSAKTLSTIADGAFIGGGVAVGGALLWALLIPRAPGARSPSQTGSARAWLPSAQCNARGCDIQVGGKF